MEYEEYKDSDLKIYRKIGNSKLDIFQSYQEPVFRNFLHNEKLKKFQYSYEHNIIKNESIKVLSNVSNSLIYSIANNISLYKTKHLMKKIFISEDVSNKDNKIENIYSKYNSFVKGVKIKQLKEDQEFIYLCMLIDSPNFDKIMRKDKEVLKSVLAHEYLKYHDKYEEIINIYTSILEKDDIGESIMNVESSLNE